MIKLTFQKFFIIFIDDFIKEINKIRYNDESEPQINIPKVDLIKELNEINIKTTYLDFYNNIQSIFFKVKDGHFNILFQNIFKYYLYIPINIFMLKQ